jgi:hypothetical protein
LPPHWQRLNENGIRDIPAARSAEAINETAKISEPIEGNKLYQERARRALSLLVRQAEAGQTIFYSDLAQELNMPNPRNLNYPLGSIGRTLERLSKKWKERIPPIQCLVLNRNSGLPGNGIGWFLMKREEFSKLSKIQQKEIVNRELIQVFTYPKWQDVLRFLSLPYVAPDFSKQVQAAACWTGGGEKEDHRRLKEFVARNPECIGLPSNTDPGEMEFALPSGDSLDVSLRSGIDWIAAEVKPLSSKTADITRGIFQCIKYQSVMVAVQIAKGVKRSARVVLVLQGTLPNELLPLKDMLSIEIIENIVPSIKES